MSTEPSTATPKKRRGLILVLIAVAVALAVTATAVFVALRPDASSAADSPEGVEVSFPGNPDLEASIADTEITDAMRDAVLPTVEIHKAADISLEGAFPADGADITFTRPEGPAPEEALAYVAFWDEAAQEWVPVPSRMNEDRTAVTARVDHFSIWGFFETIKDAVVEGAESGDFFNIAGRFLGTHAAPPTCSDAVPSWAAATADAQNPNNGLLSCWQSDPADPELLQVKIVNNRVYGSIVWSAVEPVKVETDAGDGLEWKTLSMGLADTPVLHIPGVDTPGHRYPVIPLGTVTLSYDKETVLANYGDLDESGEHLIGLHTNPGLAVLGIAMSLAGLNPSEAGSFQGIGLMKAINGCSLEADDEGDWDLGIDELAAFTGCMGDAVDAITDWEASSNDPERRPAGGLMIDLSKLGKRALAVTGAVTAFNAAVDLFGDASAEYIDFLPSQEAFPEFVRSVLWETYTTTDGALQFDIRDEWTVRELPSQSNDFDESSGVALEVLDGNGNTLAILMSGLIGGDVMIPLFPYTEFEYTPLQQLINTDQAGRMDPAFVFQALEKPSGFEAQMGITNFGRFKGTEAGVLPQGFSFLKGAGGGFFSRYITQDTVLPVDPALTGEARLTAYMNTEEYRDIRDMMMSLRFAPAAE